MNRKEKKEIGGFHIFFSIYFIEEIGKIKKDIRMILIYLLWWNFMMIFAFLENENFRFLTVIRGDAIPEKIIILKNACTEGNSFNISRKVSSSKLKC